MLLKLIDVMGKGKGKGKGPSLVPDSSSKDQHGEKNSGNRAIFLPTPSLLHMRWNATTSSWKVNAAVLPVGYSYILVSSRM